MFLETHPNRTNGKERAIGYWSEDVRPQDYVDESWDREERQAVINYVGTAESVKYSWRGMSRCRFCQCRNGSQCHTDGVYVWPQGFVHYLIEHDVKPPQEFIDHALKNYKNRDHNKHAERRRKKRLNLRGFDPDPQDGIDYGFGR